MKTRYQITEHEEWLCTDIIDCAYKVRSVLGPGLLEKIYETCFCHELHKKGIYFQRQVLLPIEHDGITFDEGLKMDVFADELIIYELKAVDVVNPAWTAQLLSHLKLTGKRVGFLKNFNVPVIKNGVRRYCVK